MKASVGGRGRGWGAWGRGGGYLTTRRLPVLAKGEVTIVTVTQERGSEVHRICAWRVYPTGCTLQGEEERRTAGGWERGASC